MTKLRRSSINIFRKQLANEIFLNGPLVKQKILKINWLIWLINIKTILVSRKLKSTTIKQKFSFKPVTGKDIANVFKYLNPEFIKPFFTVKEIPYNLHNRHILNLPSARTTYYGTSSILFRACQVWTNLALSMKQSQTLLQFKTNIKILRNIECLCKICKRS